MQRLEPDDKSLVNNFACKVPQTISTTPEGQAEEAIPAAMLRARELPARGQGETNEYHETINIVI